MSAATVYTKATAVKVSTLLLAVLLGITVAGLPVAAWLVWVALGRVTITDTTLEVRPHGGTIRWVDVDRFGIGFKSGALDSDQPSVRSQTVHLMLQDNSGRQLTVHIGNYQQGRELLHDIKRRVGRAPEPLNVSFLFQRLSFAKRP